MRKRIACIVTLIVLTSLTLTATNRPKLVIFISVDQMRADYLQRFKSNFSGGLRLLMDHGTVYRNASLNYAPSETGPGHAALSTGCYPSQSGILSNDWFDPATRKDVYCVEDTSAEKVGAEGGGVSPRNLKVTTIGDWLKVSSPDSKVLAVSAKDRAAILMGGKHADYAFWYDSKSGHMVTSEYYTRSEPDWAQSFNASNWVEHHVPDAWRTLHPSQYYERFGPDTLEGEMVWDGSTAFPHPFAPRKKNEQILRSPYGDMLVLDFARAALQAEQLGQRTSTDLLCISLSCTDYIGHAFGPNSREMADQMMWLDKSLGSFLSDAERMVGRGNVFVVLSADHSVMPLPEYTINVEHKFARRISASKIINPAIEALDRSLEQELGTSDHVIRSNAFLNYTAALNAGVDSLELEHRVKEGLLKIDGIVDVYFRRELLDTTTPERPFLERIRRGYFPARGEDFLVRFCENCLVSSSKTGTSHGSPYDYDTHVPIVFWGTGLKSKTVDRAVHSVDIAPTLANMLGLSYPSAVDGHPLNELVH
jgi:predicted AlkP superfamily pyrophosphatase or phosphodiesterase